MQQVTPSALHLRGFERCMAYFPVSGRVVWREHWNPATPKARIGGDVGSPAARNRGVVVSWDGHPRRFYVHRIAWFLFYGEWPVLGIDHINRDGFDNRITNLRLATQAQNVYNHRQHSTNTTGFRGVRCYEGPKGVRWYANVFVGKVPRGVGAFDTPEEASAAVESVYRLLHGEFYHNPNGATP